MYYVLQMLRQNVCHRLELKIMHFVLQTTVNAVNIILNAENDKFPWQFSQ